jgi:hypothetical protein
MSASNKHTGLMSVYHERAQTSSQNMITKIGRNKSVVYFIYGKNNITKKKKLKKI